MVAIEAEKVSKQYTIGSSRNGSHGSLRESIANAAGASWRRLQRFATREKPSEDTSELWALKDVSFTIRKGDAVGVVGRNGAGKSTLLKILSNITEPTQGQITIRGRVGSLLEVGTGFHPELTGRENILLYGAIIGMSRREVSEKYNDIVEFSEVGKFIDTPVKRYSSGMYVKLAFAVAAHMEPEILLLDEVLSVGDLGFQRKCMEHAKRMLSRKLTLLFVSHSMFSIKALCARSIYLSEGSVVLDGPTDAVVSRYEHDSHLDISEWALHMVGSDPNKCPIRVERVELSDEQGEIRSVYKVGERIRILLHYRAREPVLEPNFSIGLVRSDGVNCCNYNTAMDGFATGMVAGDGVIELLLPPIRLVAESYSIYIMIWDHHFLCLHCAQNGPKFHVADPVLNTHFGVFHESAEWCWHF